MATLFQWSDDKQCMVPIETIIGSEVVTPLKAIAEAILESRPTGKKRGRVAAYDPGPDAIAATTKLPEAWLSKLTEMFGTANKSHALYLAIEHIIEQDKLAANEAREVTPEV